MAKWSESQLSSELSCQEVREFRWEARLLTKVKSSAEWVDPSPEVQVVSFHSLIRWSPFSLVQLAVCESRRDGDCPSPNLLNCRWWVFQSLVRIVGIRGSRESTVRESIEYSRVPGIS